MRRFISFLALVASASAMAAPNYNYRERLARQGNFFDREMISNELNEIPLGRQGGAPAPAVDPEIKCVQKVMNIDRTIFDEEERCTHISNEECHLTYVTIQEHVEREDCKEEFVKTCNIEVVDRPFNHEIQVCNQPLVRDCDQDGAEVCTEEVVTVCSSNLMEATVKVDVPNCVTEFKEVCKNDDGVTDCFKVPTQKCTTMEMDVRKLSGEPSCKPVRKQICGPEKCPIVKGEEECHMETRTEVKRELEESCSVTPNKVCSKVMEPMPVLKQIEQCVDVPKEICSMVRVNPRIISEPAIREWCGPADLLPEADPPADPVAPAPAPIFRLESDVAEEPKRALVADEKQEDEAIIPEVTGRKVTFSPEALKEMLERSNVNVRVAGDKKEETAKAPEDDGRTAKIWRQ